MPRENLQEDNMIASLHRLSRDGRSWIAAEAAFAKAELASDGRRLIGLFVMAALVLGCLFSAVILLSLFVVVLAAPHVGGLAIAAGLLAVGLLIVAALTSWRIWVLVTKEFGIKTMLTRWWNIFGQTSERKNERQR